MAVTLSATNFIRSFGTASAPTVVLPTDVPANATIFVGIMHRAQTATLTSIADPVNGTWAGGDVRDTQTSNNASTSFINYRTWCAAKLASSALTGSGNRTLTVTFSSSVSYHIVAGWLSSDAGAMTYIGTAGPNVITSNTTAWATNSVAVTGTGAVVAFHGAQNGQSANPTMGGSAIRLREYDSNGDVPSEGRSFAYGLTFSGSSNQSISATLADSASGNFHLLAFGEPGGSGGIPRAAMYYNRRD
jgi:hypothetical protein